MNGIQPKIRRAQVFDAIKSYIEEFGYPPTTRELAKRVGLSSPTNITRHLKDLEEEGKIKRTPGVNRGIKVLDQ